MNVTIVAPHPDDEVLGCGGTIAYHVESGDSVHIIVVTRGIPELFSAEEINATRKELSAAHAILGVSSVEFLDFPAPKLDSVPGYRVADRIRQALQACRTDTVYLPYGGDLHSDHRVVYHATLVAARPINGRGVRRLLCYETLSETNWSAPTLDAAFAPAVFVDITKYLDRKLAAMQCYRSQIKDPPHPRSLEVLRALARLRGAAVGVDAAEAFVLVREIVA